jgi:hypothetical protein
MATKPKVVDLTKRPPRSPRVRLGGYALLPRMLDKGRAELAGKKGEYEYACPNDQRFLDFVGVSAEPIKELLAQGKGDQEVLDWIEANAKNKHTPEQIAEWSASMERRVPDNPDSQNYFNELLAKVGPNRKDIKTWADLLDLDDYVSFGGKA